MKSLLAAVVCGLSLTGSLFAQEWGTIKGKFKLDGTAPTAGELVCNKDPATCCKEKLIDETLVVAKDGGIANVYVYVRSKVAKIHPDYDKQAAEALVIDNNKCVFKPHAAIWWSKQKLTIKNSDDVGHNMNFTSINHGFNVLVSGNQSVDKTIESSKADKVDNLPYEVSCNVHPWMKARLMVRDNPYGAVSAADGSFEIKNIPVGSVEFVFWHEKAGYLEVPFAGGTADKKGRFTLDPKGDKDLGEIKVPVAKFTK